ncbi:MOSC domain-containing protein [Streptomyces sp. 3MP-14]|uniref:MOSC domain-containing protein n=1 Tax=Streptomyces mimosae TaxID=2586635 RepID=A0A5N5ZUF8_9ACTN|nr:MULTISPECIES: MOSC domain-containing protein [Streptomyces]KAB8160157.1 MOSC domain-containing protein [Streptomyces mimosae]KAB8176674.1 MOSC domain-containing protein [Streptomyces sp. 3MP-14]
MSPILLTVNAGKSAAVARTDAPSGLTGIDKRPVDGEVAVSAPGPRGVGGSGLAGDSIADLRHHGGDDQAVYTYAREDLDHWAAELGHPLENGVFGENLTTEGIDVNDTRVGERWRVGDELLLEATSPRIPCATFADWIGERRWVKRFAEAARPGAYFRVLRPGTIRAGDRIEVVHRPTHEVSVAFAFRAQLGERSLRPRVLAAGPALHSELYRNATAWAENA